MKKNRKHIAALTGMFAALLLLCFVTSVYAAELADSEIKIEYFEISKGRIAFTYLKGKQKDIYVIDFELLRVTPLVSSPVNDEYPSWSPKGDKLAFYSELSGDRDIYTVNSDGSELVQLTHSPGHDEDPHWSPDGTQIIFHSTRNGSGSELFIMNSDGSDQLLLGINKKRKDANNTVPKWSPRGNEILYSTDEDWPGWDIAVFDRTSSKSKFLTKGKQSFCRGGWDPTGSSFAFSYGAGTTVDIWEFKKGGSKPSQLISTPGRDYDAIWLDSGEKLVFSSEAEPGNKNFQLFVWDKKKNKIFQITSAPGSLRNPSWTSLPSISSLKKEAKHKIGLRQETEDL